MAPLHRCILATLWPAFLMAGVLEALVFAVVDPYQLRWLGAGALDWPASAVYTVAFFAFWVVSALTAALALMLEMPAERINGP